jgi:hypothetical protein
MVNTPYLQSMNAECYRDAWNIQLPNEDDHIEPLVSHHQTIFLNLLKNHFLGENGQLYNWQSDCLKLL